MYEAQWRYYNLRMAAYTAAGRLRRTPLLGNLEATELQYLSYFMGMTLSVYVAQVSGFTFPMHFARFAAVNGGLNAAYTQNAAFAVNYNLPDIVFINPVIGTCQIWEAKSRGAGAAGFPAAGVPGVLTGAMGQARRVATALVGGAQVPPNAWIGSVATLATNNPLLWGLYVGDPPGDSKRPREEGDVTATENFYREFYRPYIEMVADSRRTVTFGGRTYVVADIPDTSTIVGLDERIYRIFTQSPAKRPRSDDLNVPPPPTDIVNTIQSYLADGYPQDPADPNRYVSVEGIFTQAVEQNIEQRPG